MKCHLDIDSIHRTVVIQIILREGMEEEEEEDEEIEEEGVDTEGDREGTLMEIDGTESGIEETDVVFIAMSGMDTMHREMVDISKMGEGVIAENMMDAVMKQMMVSKKGDDLILSLNPCV